MSILFRTTAAAAALSLIGLAPTAGAEPQEAVSQLEAMTLQHIAIRVTDFDTTVAWYKEIFGAREQIRWDAPPYIDPDLRFAYLEFNGVVLEIAGGGSPMHIAPRPQTMAEDFTRSGWAHICFVVEDAEAAMAELKAKGVEIYAGPFTNPTLNRTFFHIKDPEGTWIEFVEILGEPSAQ